MVAVIWTGRPFWRLSKEIVSVCWAAASAAASRTIAASARPTRCRITSGSLGSDELLRLRLFPLLAGAFARQDLRLVDLRHVGFVPEVELDHHAVGIVQEDLLQRPRRHLADLERHLVLLDAVDAA